MAVRLYPDPELLGNDLAMPTLVEALAQPGTANIRNGAKKYQALSDAHLDPVKIRNLAIEQYEEDNEVICT